MNPPALFAAPVTGNSVDESALGMTHTKFNPTGRFPESVWQNDSMQNQFPTSHPNPFTGLGAHTPTPFERQQLDDLETAIDLLNAGGRDLQTIELFNASVQHVENMAKERHYSIPDDWGTIKHDLISIKRGHNLNVEDF